MNPSSVFLRIKENILVEFVYSQEIINGAFKKYLNSVDNSQNLVNNYNMKPITNNVETSFVVNSGAGYMAVVDVNDGFYYPNSNDSISGVQLPSGVNLKYDTVKIHVRSGYNFQDTEGFFSNIFIKNLQGNKISLASQVAFKGDLSQFKYNNTPIRISEVTFDKYVEYKILSVSEILNGSNPTASYFNANFTNLSTNPVIYMDFGYVSKVDSSEGFVKFWNISEEMISIPAFDGFNYLQPHLVERNSYFEYSAMWDGNSIENFITIMNSKAGNAYHIEHEIAVYEQRGFDFYEVQRHNSVQKFNYDKPLKFRPVISNQVDGSLHIEYVMKLFNSADNTSVVKRAMLNTDNFAPYLEEPLRISVPVNNQIKVYNKVIRKDINIDNKKSLFDNKVIIPIYYSNVAVKVDGDDFLLELVPFDNIYSIYLNKEVNGQDAPLTLEPSVQYQLVFITSSGEKVRVIENDITGKMNGILNFKISAEQSNIILRDNSGKFYINTVTDVVETNVCVGEWINKERRGMGVVDSIISDAEIAIVEPTRVFETVSESVPVISVPVTNDNVGELTQGNGVNIVKNDIQEFDIQDIPVFANIDTVKNPVIGDTQQISVIPNGSQLPIKINFSAFDSGFIRNLSIMKQQANARNVNNIIKYLGIKPKR